jgi:hypothetical protein
MLSNDAQTSEGGSVRGCAWIVGCRLSCHHICLACYNGCLWRFWMYISSRVRGYKWQFKVSSHVSLLALLYPIQPWSGLRLLFPAPTLPVPVELYCARRRLKESALSLQASSCLIIFLSSLFLTVQHKLIWCELFSGSIRPQKTSTFKGILHFIPSGSRKL